MEHVPGPIGHDRVREVSPDTFDERIDRRTHDRLRAYRGASPAAIRARVDELDREWDLERALMANAAVIALSGTVLASQGDRRWLAVPAVVTSFLLLHAVQGWCPPVPVFRALGFRTRQEIDSEKDRLLGLLPGRPELSPP